MADTHSGAPLLPQIASGEGRSVVEQLILEQLGTLRSEQRSGFEGLRAEFNGRIDKLVSTEAFAAEQRRVDDRVSVLHKDIAAEQLARKESERKAQERADRLSRRVIALAGGVLVPVTLYLLQLIPSAGGA